MSSDSNPPSPPDVVVEWLVVLDVDPPGHPMSTPSSPQLGGVVVVVVVVGVGVGAGVVVVVPELLEEVVLWGVDEAPMLPILSRPCCMRELGEAGVSEVWEPERVSSRVGISDTIEAKKDELGLPHAVSSATTVGSVFANAATREASLAVRRRQTPASASTTYPTSTSPVTPGDSAALRFNQL
jgi:hypothetical protein